MSEGETPTPRWFRPGGRSDYGTFSEAYRDLARLLVEEAEHVPSPRGEPVREVLGASFALADPRARVVTQAARGFNKGFAAGEFLWYLRGADDVESLEYYNRRTPQFSDDGVTLAGAYGPRMFTSTPTLIAPWPWAGATSRSPWEEVREELLRDNDSRRAVLQLYSNADLARAHSPGGTRDVPCTTSLQFIVRREAEDASSQPRLPGVSPRSRLHVVATMRSCDFVWGLANDVFSFTLLQETMSLELRDRGLDVDVGRYVHQAGSLHLYGRHDGAARALVAEPVVDCGRMPPVERRADLAALVRDEALLRRGQVLNSAAYSGGALWLRAALDAHRARRDAEARARERLLIERDK